MKSDNISVINEFRGKFAFLSNFHPSRIEYQGITYPTVEHAYQAAKFQDQETKLKIAALKTPGDAKRAGKYRKMSGAATKKWDVDRVEIMEELVRLKFSKDPMRALLHGLTGEAKLVEGNWWGDKFWGVDKTTGEGMNMLGEILMIVRKEIRGEL